MIKGKQPYILDGIVYPSVTEILNIINKPQLVEWFKRKGFEEILEEGERATSIGDMVHDIIHQTLSGKKVEIPKDYPYVDEVKKCVSAFIDWYQKFKFKKIELEYTVFHKQYFYAGTFDCLGRTADGKIILFDWKTSSAIYPEYHLQLAAYKYAYEHQTGQKVDECWIVRFGKKDGEFEARQVNGLERKFVIFLYAYEIYKYINSFGKGENYNLF